jgi:hypothetical protein
MKASSLLMTALLVCACASSGAEPDVKRFLEKVDAALLARDRDALERLADLASWNERREERLELLLPPAPVKRERVVSETEVLYRDGDGKSWRLRLRRSGDSFLIAPRERLCPQGGQRKRLADGSAPAPNRGRPSTWAPLECWPLPN